MFTFINHSTACCCLCWRAIIGRNVKSIFLHLKEAPLHTCHIICQTDYCSSWRITCILPYQEINRVGHFITDYCSSWRITCTLPYQEMWNQSLYIRRFQKGTTTYRSLYHWLLLFLEDHLHPALSRNGNSIIVYAWNFTHLSYLHLSDQITAASGVRLRGRNVV